MKFLLWLAVGAILVIWLIRGKTAPSIRSRRTTVGDAENTESMLQCAHCGIHIPASEAVRDAAGVVFCSEAHRLQHAPD